MTTNTKNPNRSKKVGCAIFFVLVALAILVCISLACVSFGTTGYIWDGAFPAGEYHLMIGDHQGKPVQGAVLNICRTGSRTPSYGYPFDNYAEGGELVSDQQGQISVYHVSRGFEFGGRSWVLFWLIPMGSDSPQYELEIAADGYTSAKMPADRVFELAYNSSGTEPASTVDINGEAIELRVFEMPVVLEK
jgi:hypothetical protein